MPRRTSCPSAALLSPCRCAPALARGCCHPKQPCCNGSSLVSHHPLVSMSASGSGGSGLGGSDFKHPEAAGQMVTVSRPHLAAPGQEQSCIPAAAGAVWRSGAVTMGKPCGWAGVFAVGWAGAELCPGSADAKMQARCPLCSRRSLSPSSTGQWPVWAFMPFLPWPLQPASLPGSVLQARAMNTSPSSRGLVPSWN